MSTELRDRYTELRDRFFALSSGGAPPEEVGRFRAEVDATCGGAVTTVDGLAVSWHPTARFKAVRFVDAERLDEDVREWFARPIEDAQYLAAVFADPHELSFRTFENILPLDRVFADVPLEFVLDGRTEIAEGAFAFGMRVPDATRTGLEGLDSLDLYVPPLNSGSRGGERFIFHSALLAEALTGAVAKAMPEALMDGFSHVNPVFRCNRFEPGDANFHRHRDTPYRDAARKQASRYTVLLYLTGGSGADGPVLDLGGAGALTEIPAFTCVVFDQRYEHEGAPYRDGRKVFLRSELVFTEEHVGDDPEIGALFSKACYLTGESVFAPELARHADDYYNRVAAAHWNGLTPGDGAEPFVHKRFRGVEFVANGYDFWFAKGDGITAAECAAITLLDYFNCKIGDRAFRDLCEADVVEAADAEWIPGFLADRRSSSAVPPFDKSALFPEPERPDDGEIPCCGFHMGGVSNYDMTRNADTIGRYTELQEKAKQEVMPAPILLLGEEVVLDPDRFVVEGNLVHVLGKDALTPVNFAACQGPDIDPKIFVGTERTVGAVDVLVPPILFTETADLFHLRFDFFRNSWTVGHAQSEVQIPMIREPEEEDFFWDDEDWDEDDDEWDEDEDDEETEEDEGEDESDGEPKD
ncbi:2OG-Fe(II) oxygenase [Actinomadura rupiterrae]|uniref:2OG-Fe(II) oxygenase n=1 Tax=Actinomadura rupiterrae TaxID=559627 RepID=UPI0020A39D40|nr:2OG-Fe(II) oxygenase [Actinomadura rupiterrae]MCP2340595.1 hypothetical protein [Actinomadura rupiterrae]